MIAIFPKKDPRRNWGGYDFILRPGEFIQSPHKEMHIHVLGEKGSLKVRLNPVARDKSQPTSLPASEVRKIIRFIEQNIADIKNQILQELALRNIKVSPF